MNKITKISLSVLLIFFLLIPSVLVPRPAKSAPAVVNIANCVGAGLLANYLTGLIPGTGSLSEVPVSEGNLRNKEGTLDIAARCTARQLFDGSISGMLDIVRTGGRDGAAAYVKDWRNFQANAEYRGEDIFRAILSNTKLCNYIDRDIKGFFGVTSKITLPPKTQTRIGNLDPYQLRATAIWPKTLITRSNRKVFRATAAWIGCFR